MKIRLSAASVRRHSRLEIKRMKVLSKLHASIYSMRSVCGHGSSRSSKEMWSLDSEAEAEMKRKKRKSSAPCAMRI